MNESRRTKTWYGFAVHECWLILTLAQTKKRNMNPYDAFVLLPCLRTTSFAKIRSERRQKWYSRVAVHQCMLTPILTLVLLPYLRTKSLACRAPGENLNCTVLKQSSFLMNQFKCMFNATILERKRSDNNLKYLDSTGKSNLNFRWVLPLIKFTRQSAKEKLDQGQT